MGRQSQWDEDCDILDKWGEAQRSGLRHAERGTETPLACGSAVRFMVSRHKKRTGRSEAATPTKVCAQEVERLIAKLRLKEAVQEARLCYKQESTPEHHRLLERAYLLRAD